MVNSAALKAFCVEMLTAIAAFSDVLINGTVALFIAKFAKNVRCAQLGNMSVDAAFFLCVSVKRKTQLLGGKLTVWIFCQEIAESPLSVGVIEFLFHGSPYSF